MSDIDMSWPVQRTVLTVIGFVAGLAIANSSAAGYHAPQSFILLPPVASACVSSPFGPRILPNKPLAGVFHNGIDLPAQVGSPVTAVAPGTVIRIQRHGIGGLEILIQHEGFIGVYSHLGQVTPILARGVKTIYGGERIATVGMTGLTYGPHLYFGMIINGRPVDPAPHLNIAVCSANMAAHDDRLRPTRMFAQH